MRSKGRSGAVWVGLLMVATVGDAVAFTSFGSSAALHRVEVSAAAGVTGAELQALCAG